MDNMVMFLLVMIALPRLSSGNNQFFGVPIFGTKTPYLWLLDASRTITEDKNMKISYNSTSYRAVYVDGTVRHGARHPSSKWVKRFKELYNQFNDSSEFNKTDWNNFSMDLATELSNLGQNEQEFLGSSFGTQLKSLFKGKTPRVIYYVTKKSRTVDSSRYFYLGLIHAVEPHTSTYDITTSVDNTMLRFADNCDRYIQEVEDNDAAFAEAEKFENRQEVTNIIKDVNAKVKTAGYNVTLDLVKVQTIQQMCANELGLFNSSNWCKFLTLDNLKVLDYLNDITDYTESGYAYDINYKISCPLFESIFKQMDDAISKNGDSSVVGYRIGTFRFAHSSTVGPMYPVLGLFKDSVPPEADNYKSQQNRKWKSSEILPFSANVVFTLYKAEEENADVKYVVTTHVNERPVTIPACGSFVCPYGKLRKHLESYIDHCSFEEMCKVVNDPSTASQILYSSTFLTILMSMCLLKFVL